MWGKVSVGTDEPAGRHKHALFLSGILHSIPGHHLRKLTRIPRHVFK